MKVHLHIEQLTLDGVALGSHGAVELKRVLRERLTALLNERGIGNASAGPRASSIGRITAASIDVGARPDAAAVGASVAESLHASLGGVQGESPGRASRTHFGLSACEP